MKLLNKTAALLGAGLISAAGLLLPGAAFAQDTYTVSDDLMAGCVDDGLSEAACECILRDISVATDITEFDLANIEGAIEDYVELEGEAAFGELIGDCAAKYP